MRNKKFKCKFCDSIFFSLDQYSAHIEKKHNEMIPEDMVPNQFVYFLNTGKTHGNCVVCKNKTTWNEKTNKYNRFCKNPNCKDKYRELFKKRMIGKYGKVHLLNDAEQQKKMLANRSISGEYVWRDRVHKSSYTGSYEKEFLIFLDKILNFDPEDVMSPSPHTYYYKYENQTHFYIPDFFIPSIGVEIEIKDGGDNPNMHHKIQAVDKVKEKLKDDVMMNNEFHYIKIVNKENMKFVEFLTRLKDFYLNKENKKIFMIESSESNEVTLDDLNALYTENIDQDIDDKMKGMDYYNA